MSAKLVFVGGTDGMDFANVAAGVQRGGNSSNDFLEMRSDALEHACVERQREETAPDPVARRLLRGEGGEHRGKMKLWVVQPSEIQFAASQQISGGSDIIEGERGEHRDALPYPGRRPS